MGDYFYDKSMTNKANNGTVDGKSTGKSLVDMVKNESKTSGFGFNIDERINRILQKNNKEKDFELTKEPRNKVEIQNAENSKSNFNSLYSLETRETISSRYKLCSLAKGDNKKGNLGEITELKEDTYYA